MSGKPVTLAHKAREELAEYSIISAYLYVCFGAIILYKAAILRGNGIDYALYGTALFKALIIGKFITIGEMARIGERHGGRRLITAVLKRFPFFSC